MPETVDASALVQIPWFNPNALDGRRINLMPYWDGAEWFMYFFNEGKAIKLAIVDVGVGTYLANTPKDPADMRILFAETMWQRASYPKTIHFIDGVLDDFVNFSASVSKLNFFHLNKNSIDAITLSSYVKTEIEYLLSLARGVFDLLQELISVLWQEHVRLFDDEKEKIRKQKKLPSSFADIALVGESDIRSIEDIVQKWGLPDKLALEYTRIAPFFLELRRWRNRVIHSGGKVSHVYSEDSGFMVNVTDKLFAWANCWEHEDIGVNNLASLDPWLAKIIFESMNACNRFIEIFAQIVSCLLYTSPSPRDQRGSRMPSSA